MFKVNNKKHQNDVSFSPFSSVSIVDLEDVNVSGVDVTR